MAKSQQRSSKETKKPKKDDSSAKPLSPGAVTARSRRPCRSSKAACPPRPCRPTS